MANHGVWPNEKPTEVAAPIAAQTGIPFVVGGAPIYAADHPAAVGVPVLVNSWREAVDAFGYVDAWGDYNLCEAIYSHFKVFGRSPMILLNLFDPATMVTTQAAASKSVVNHVCKTGLALVNDSSLVIKNGNDTLAENTDYTVSWENGDMVLTLVATSTHYSASSLSVAGNKANPAGVTAASVVTGIGNVELCMSSLGVIPDLLMAPKFSETATVAVALAAAAANINGLFKAKALVDIPTTAGSGDTYTGAITLKSSNALTDPNMIVCWPLAKIGNLTFHMSTLLAGVIAATDEEYGAPCASPSNHTMHITALAVSGGAQVLLTLAQANTLYNAGIMTALNLMGDFVAWGNYTGCYPAKTDVKDAFIPVSRMFDYVSNGLVRMFWGYLDVPLTSRILDSIVDSANIWINGLVGSGYLLGGRVEYDPNENTTTNLMQGIVKFHVFITPPSPMQEVDFSVEYDVSYLETLYSA